MTPSRPYLLRAIYDWLLDNGMTPHLLVDAEVEGINIPMQFVQDGRIILNLNPSAIQNLVLDNEEVLFSARFGGTPFNIYIPMQAVLGIYAKENGQGTMFKDEDGFDFPEGDPEPPPPPKKDTRPKLRVVK
ncbi:MAG: ClpXP protease specificity-enhancing factor [Thiotrichaceae bacterium]